MLCRLVASNVPGLLHSLGCHDGLLRLTRLFVRHMGADAIEYKALFDTMTTLSACLCACCNPIVEHCFRNVNNQSAGIHIARRRSSFASVPHWQPVRWLSKPP